MAFTHWELLKKIDAHIHILPDAVHKANPDSDDVWLCTDIHGYCAMMDDLHIEKAVIMPLNDPWLMSMEFTIDAVHRNLRDMKNASPGRFCAFADIDTRNTPAQSAEAIRKALDGYGLDGIKIHPNNTRCALDDEYNAPIFALAQQRNIPVAIHSYPNSAEDVCAAKRIGRILERYPGLRLIVAHMGGSPVGRAAGRCVLRGYVRDPARLCPRLRHRKDRRNSALLRGGPSAFRHRLSRQPAFVARGDLCRLFRHSQPNGFHGRGSRKDRVYKHARYNDSLQMNDFSFYQAKQAPDISMSGACLLSFTLLYSGSFRDRRCRVLPCCGRFFPRPNPTI